MENEVLTALVVGAGAVENAWAPVLRALQPYYDFPLTADGANCVLARLVYVLRWFASINSDLGRQELTRHKEFLVEVRTAICRELRSAQKDGEIHEREEFETIMRTMLIAHSRKFMLVTTNWDTVVSEALSRILTRTMIGVVWPLHIHGSVNKMETLYLPTEMTKEPYRSHEEEHAIGGLHGSIWRGLERAHRVVLYGLSLSPLDAELGQTMACGWSNANLREINVVSPDHDIVAHRVNLLLDGRREVTVKGYHPLKLGDDVDYTVKLRPSS